MKTLFAIRTGAAFAPLLFVLGCAQRPPATADAAFDGCIGIAAGVSCRVPVGDSTHVEMSECTRERDGSLMCVSPALPPVAARERTIEDFGK